MRDNDDEPEIPDEDLARHNRHEAFFFDLMLRIYNQSNFDEDEIIGLLHNTWWSLTEQVLKRYDHELITKTFMQLVEHRNREIEGYDELTKLRLKINLT